MPGRAGATANSSSRFLRLTSSNPWVARGLMRGAGDRRVAELAERVELVGHVGLGERHLGGPPLALHAGLERLAGQQRGGSWIHRGHRRAGAGEQITGRVNELRGREVRCHASLPISCSMSPISSAALGTPKWVPSLHALNAEAPRLLIVLSRLSTLSVSVSLAKRPRDARG